MRAAYTGGYVVSFSELQNCLTCGETIQTAIANAEGAKREWIRAAIKINVEIPELLSNNVSYSSHTLLYAVNIISVVLMCG